MFNYTPRIAALASVCLITACSSTAELTAQLHSERAAHRTALETARQQTLAAEARAFVTAMQHSDPETARLAVFGLAMSKQARDLVGNRNDLDPLPVIEGWDDKLLRFVGVALPAAVQVTGQVMNYRLGSKQAEYSRDVALGDQRTRVDTVRAVGEVAMGGFNALATVGQTPTTITTVNGNGNAVNGSRADNSTTTTTTTQCHSGTAGSSSANDNGNSSGAPSGSVACK